MSEEGWPERIGNGLYALQANDPLCNTMIAMDREIERQNVGKPFLT